MRSIESRQSANGNSADAAARVRVDVLRVVLAYAGIAPVIERSGQKAWTHWRYACPTFLRQTFVEWVNQTIKFSFWARAYYQLQKDRGKTHQVAIRALAFKWIRILFRCWKNATPYDESKYLMALQQKGSPLLKSIAKT